MSPDVSLMAAQYCKNLLGQTTREVVENIAGFSVLLESIDKTNESAQPYLVPYRKSIILALTENHSSDQLLTIKCTTYTPKIHI